MQHVVEATPLSEPVFFVLASLTRAPCHGYGLMKDIEVLSESRVKLSTGTLYGVLRRLLEDQWIERFDTGDTARDKQSYRITAAGSEALRQESLRLNQLARIALPLIGFQEA